MIYYEKTSRPALLIDSNGNAEQMKRIPFMSGSFNEEWLQEILADNPALIPASDLGEEFSSLVCIGREVPVGSGDTQGYIDNLYVSASGNIVIAETKLFRNQESRRTVVAQIIDYAKELQKWDCEMLNKVANDYYFRKEGQAYDLLDLMIRKGYLSYADGGAFTDRVNQSLSKAKFLLMIVGDGIRSNVQQLADFLNENTSMQFRLALAEMEIYQHGEDVVVIPNLLTKTAVLERTVVNVGGALIEIEEPSESESPKYIRKPILSRREFIDAFASNGGYDPDDIYELIADLESISGLSVRIAPTELTIRFSPDGEHTYPLMTFGISSGDSALWIVPGRIKAALDKHGVLPPLADDFLESYKHFIATKRCKTPPYENASGFYYADMDTVLRNKQDFIASSEQFSVAIQDK